MHKYGNSASISEILLVTGETLPPRMILDDAWLTIYIATTLLPLKITFKEK